MGSNAVAANTADLKVVGKIVPAGCTPTFTGGGTVDYGTITASTLSATTDNNLGAKPVTYNIACSAPVKIMVSFSDSRTSSALDDYGFGLGMQGSNKIGYYSIRTTAASTAQADGVPATNIWTSDGGANWVGYSTNSPIKKGATKGVGFATPGTMIPGAFKNYTSSVNVDAVIPKGNFAALDLTKEISLDGLAVMEVKYL